MTTRKLSLILSIATLLVTACNNKSNNKQSVDYVNPMVGTDFHGHTFPGALLPFGSVQLSPDTRLDGWDGCSGYHYSDSVVYGFTHTHLSGTGCSDYGDVLLMPFEGEGSVKNTEYSATFSHNNETTQAGYYSLVMDNGIKAELTAGKYVGVHRYTFPNDGEKGFVLDLQHRDKTLSSELKYDGKSLSGYRVSNAWNTEQYIAFSLETSIPIETVKFYTNDSLTTEGEKITGDNCKALVYFPDSVKQVVVKVAISAVGEDGAVNNQKEIEGFDFDKVKNDAYNCWNKELSKIEVETDDEELKKNFYTAMYHSFTAPYLFTDIDGRYLGQDKEIHTADSGRHIYTVFSLWDTYRTLHPLMNIIDRKRTEDFLYSFMTFYEQGGMLPVWELSAYETWCMIGYHSVPVIWDAYQKGICNYDKQKMLQAMVHSAKLPKLGRPEYGKYGYVPGDMEHESVSKTLEYAYDDWCIAMFAKEIGDTAIYNEFMTRCQSWKNILDKDGFMRAKINGGFLEPFDPTEVNNHFTEGNSWQYSTYVPHDFETFVAMRGGNDVMECFLDSLFNTSSDMGGRKQVDITGMVGQYAHGNEPSHHAAYLYAYLGKPWKTQELTRKIMQTLYTSKPDGLCGNEDCGQMSAWYVMSALGFYPVCPGDNQYVFGSPMFDKATIHLENGKDIAIVAKNQSDNNKYIKSIRLNGKDYTKSYITFDDIKDGATIEFTMSSKPNMEFGTAKEDMPKSKIDSKVTTVPYFSTSSKVFRDSILLEINSHQSEAANTIYYTTDGSKPTNKSLLYEQPLFLTADATIKAVAYNPETGYSKVAECNLVKYSQDKKITYHTKYQPQYSDRGDESLIDNFRGNSNYRLGGWQGFWGDDCYVTIDLLETKPVTKVSAGFLQECRPWIFYPRKMVVEVSNDGENFVLFGEYENKHPYVEEDVTTANFVVNGHAQARYVRVRAVNYGKLPDWHVSAGEPAWLFIDEIVVQ